jgi:hypothetical protein
MICQVGGATPTGNRGTMTVALSSTSQLTNAGILGRCGVARGGRRKPREWIMGEFLTGLKVLADVASQYQVYLFEES